MSASERLEEMEPTTDSWGVEVLYPHQYKPIVEALEEILAMEQRLEDSKDRAKVLVDYGYNQCLAEVKALIEGIVK